MNEKHTPGPWKWEILDESMMALGTIGYAAMEGNVLFVTRCKACQSSPPDLEHDKYLCSWPKRADAPLLAAAPELLHALELALPELKADARHSPEMRVMVDVAQAAIAKACGEVT